MKNGQLKYIKFVLRIGLIIVILFSLGCSQEKENNAFENIFELPAEINVYRKGEMIVVGENEEEFDDIIGLLNEKLVFDKYFGICDCAIMESDINEIKQEGLCLELIYHKEERFAEKFKRETEAGVIKEGEESIKFSYSRLFIPLTGGSSDKQPAHPFQDTIIHGDEKRYRHGPLGTFPHNDGLIDYIEVELFETRDQENASENLFKWPTEILDNSEIMESDETRIIMQKADDFNQLNFKRAANEYDCINKLLSILTSIDKELDPSNYYITAQEYYEGGGMIKFRHVIDEKIKTSSVYLVFVRDNQISKISDQSKEAKILNKEEELRSKAERYSKKINLEKIAKEIASQYGPGKDIIKVEEYFWYDADEDILYHDIDYVVKYADGTKARELIPNQVN